jgi:NADPH:quinone reductase
MSRAILVRNTGDPEVMQLEEHEVGEPGPGQVRIRVAAAGVNFIDTYFRTGLYARPLPFVNGMEGAGTVEAVGDGVDDLAAGDRVAWSAVPGSYSDALLASPAQLIRIPDGVDTEVAAAALLQGMTAHYLAHGVRETRPDDVALVHAAAGGTGLLLVQTLKSAGAIVYGTCSSEEKAALAREAGIDDVIRYDREDFAAAVRAKTGGTGADVVYDGVGRTTFEGSLRSLRMRGLMVLFGQASGPVPPFDLNRLNDLGSLFVTRPSLVHYIATRPEFVERAGDVLGAIADGSLRIRIGARFPLDRAADAHRALEARKTTGKVLLLP